VPSVIGEAADRAPRAPGVYFFLGIAGELLYVGKASQLQRRLRQHASERPAPGLRARYGLVHAVRWEVHPDNESAERREADVIVGLRPPFNAFVDDGRWAFVRVTDVPGTDRVRFDLAEAVGGDGRHYGCFPHLGRGVSLRPAVACSDGYVAFLRLVWAASRDPAPMPSRITRSAPPAFEVGLDRSFRRSLHAFLSGVSIRILDELSAVHGHREPYHHVGLRRDRVAAAGFFGVGPQAIRALRLRHGVPPGPVARRSFEALLASEVVAVLEAADQPGETV